MRDTLKHVEKIMETQNVTLSIRKDILHRAKIIAAERRTSLSGLMREYLEKLVDEEKGYEQAKEFCIREMNKGYEIGAKPGSYTREELHERK
jgi:hypothetical protein